MPTVVEPVLAEVFVPHTESGCNTAKDFSRVVLPAYSNQADMDSNLFIRFYNEAVKSWIENLIVIDGRKIICIKSSPLRAFSAYKHLFKNDDFNRLPEDGEAPERFPLPFANYTRGVPKVNDKLKQNSYPIRNIGFLDESNKRRTAWTRYPKPMIIPYSIDFWSKYESHMDYIIQRIHEQFVPMAYYDVGSPFSDGTILMPMKMNDLVDNSELERDSTEDRLLRVTLSMDVEAWMFYNIHQAPTFQTETQQVVAVSDKNLSDPELVFTKSFKHTDLAPLTLEERAESISDEVPTLQP
jgi:hypothetical protein